MWLVWRGGASVERVMGERGRRGGDGGEKEMMKEKTDLP